MSYRQGRTVLAVVILAVAAGGTYLAAVQDRGADPSAGPAGKAPVGVARQLRSHDPQGAVTVALEPGETAAMVIYTGVTHGAIEACGCNGNPTGGLTKELTVVEQIRSRGTPSLYVHPGDLFPYEKQPAKMAFIAQAASLMGYDAMAVGEQELIEGLARFRELATEYRLPYLSENLRDADGRRVAPGYCIKDLAGVKVGIVAVFGTERYLYLEESFMKEIVLEPVAQAVDSVLKDLEGRVDYIVLLSHQDKYLDRELARRFPDINLIVGGHDEELIPTPIRIGNTLVVNAGIVGEQIGVVHLAIDPSRHVRVLGHEFLATPAPIPKHPKIEAVYKAYIKKSKAKPEDNDASLPEAFEPARTCEPCHREIYREFMESKHARAWQTLVKAGRAEDGQCRHCHTMGYGRAGGFKSITETPNLAGVSCQACHLVTHDHHDRGLKDDLEYCQDEKTCQQCHTVVTSRDFNFWTRSESVDHHKVTEKSNDPPADYKHWRVTPVRKAPPWIKKRGETGKKNSGKK